MNKYIEKYIEKYIDWVKANLGNTLMIIGSSLVIISILYIVFLLILSVG